MTGVDNGQAKNGILCFRSTCHDRNGDDSQACWVQALLSPQERSNQQNRSLFPCCRAHKIHTALISDKSLYLHYISNSPFTEESC